MSISYKEKKKRMELIIDGLENGLFLNICCKEAGISTRTYYNWFKKGKEIAEKKLLLPIEDIKKSNLGKVDKLYWTFFIDATNALKTGNNTLLKCIKELGHDRIVVLTKRVYDKNGNLIRREEKEILRPGNANAFIFAYNQKNKNKEGDRNSNENGDEVYVNGKKVTI